MITKRKTKKRTAKNTNYNYLTMLNDIYNSDFVKNKELSQKFSVSTNCLHTLRRLNLVSSIGKHRYKWSANTPPNMQHVTLMKNTLNKRNKAYKNHYKQLDIMFNQRKKASNPRIAPAQPEKTNNTFAYLFTFLLGAVVAAVCWYAAQK